MKFLIKETKNTNNRLERNCNLENKIIINKFKAHKNLHCILQENLYL